MASIEPLTAPPGPVVPHPTDETPQHDDGPIWQRLAIYAGSLLLILTGIPLIGIRLFATSSDPFSVFLHPLQPSLQMIHVLSIPLFLVGVGALLVTHASPHYNAGLNTPSGILMLSDVGILTYSGLLLFYVGHEQSLQAILSVHILSGLAFPLILVVHIVLGIRAMRKPGEEGDLDHGPDVDSSSLR